jgi:hypothetical protein
MGKGVATAVVALVAFILMDQQLSDGRYTDVMLAILRQLQRSFG